MKDVLKIKNLYQAFRRVKPIKLLNDNYLLCENIYNLTENDLSWYDVEEAKE